MSNPSKLISIIVPCRNEIKNINECIDAFLSQKGIPPDQIEIIVVDGKSTDNTVEHIKTSFGDKVTIAYNEKQYTPYAFNIGINQSNGKYVAIIGARSVVSENYFSDAIKILEAKPEVACVGGLTVNTYENSVTEAIAIAMSSKIGVGSSNFRTMKESGYVDTIGTPVFRREIFEEIGYFDEALVRNQDDDLSYRIIKAGYKIWFDATSPVKYYVRASLKKVFGQYFQYGYWKVYVSKKHKAFTTYRQLVPAMLILFIVFGYPILSLLHIGILYPIVMAAYIAGVILTGLTKASDMKSVPIVILAIFTLHLSYGTGYLKGILDFILLRKEPSLKAKQLTR